MSANVTTDEVPRGVIRDQGYQNIPASFIPRAVAGA